MKKVVSYSEFLKNSNNLDSYLKDLFGKIPQLNVYFPNSLNYNERRLIYTKSKGYVFEKLNTVGSKYCIKMWKPDNGLNNTNDEDNEEESVISDEDGDFKECLDDISVALKQRDESVLKQRDEALLNEIQKCRRSINKVECVCTFIMIFNFVGSFIFLTQYVNNVVPFTMADTITDF